jgi:hypothetical protein
MPLQNRRIRYGAEILSQEPERASASLDSGRVEKVRLIAYQIWLVRRDRNISGDANCDYYQAEQILESYKNLKVSLVGSFGVSAVAFLLGHSPEEHYANAMNAVIGLNQLGDEYRLSWDSGERLLQIDALKID